MLCPCYCSRFSNTLSCVNSPRKCSIFMTHIVENKLNFLQRVFNFYFTEVDGEFSRCKQILYLACENLEFSNSNWSVSNSSMNPFLFKWITKRHPLNHSRKNVWLMNLGCYWIRFIRSCWQSGQRWTLCRECSSHNCMQWWWKECPHFPQTIVQILFVFSAWHLLQVTFIRRLVVLRRFEFRPRISYTA